MPAPRCLQCGYVLEGLPAGECPGCGRPFDPQNPATLTTEPPTKGLRFWLPGVILAAAGGAILYPLLIYNIGFGMTVTLVLPFCIGALIGYGCRVSRFVGILLGLIVFSGLVFGLFTLSIVGIYCGLILSGVALGPLILGALAGAFLRLLLKPGAWDNRWRLPMILILLAPMLSGTIEDHYLTPFPDEIVSTTIILPVSVDRAWDAMMFYEEVNLPPPILMRIALPRPLYTRGSVAHVGDTKVCVYSKGRLVKKIIRRIPNQTLGFVVTDQTHIENRSVTLKRGSFDFTALAPELTQVTLSTEYQPLLGPRWAWRWSERLGMRTLHDFVLRGMRAKAIQDQKQAVPLPPAANPAPNRPDNYHSVAPVS